MENDGMKRIGCLSSSGQRGQKACSALVIVAAALFWFGAQASPADTIYMAITPGKNFQHVIYPIAQDKGYMREEGIDLKTLVIAGTPSIQGLFADSIQFTVAGTSALKIGRASCRERG